MAKYVAILVSLIFFVFSVNSYVPENKTEDPSLEIIKAEDAEEGVDFQQIQDTSKTSILRRRFLESLVCQDPKTPSNTVTFISGEPLHMSSKANVTCAAGKHFTGQYADKTMVTVTCTPLPHPCMCMAAWETGDDFQLMYDFNCTSDIEENIDKKAENTKDDLPIYPFPEKDDPQCPDPTPVRGTMRILHGHPFSYGCNVLLTCDSGLVFEDGKSVWNLTCLGLSVLPPQCIWVPVHDGRPICKDDLQCPNPSPIRGTLKVLSGKPFTDGCEVSIICYPGLVLSDGKTVWNLTCVPVAHIPPVLVWIPQYTRKPTCKEPSADKETTKSGKTEMLPTDEEVQGGALTTDDQSENVSSDNNSNVLTTDTEEETGKAVIETLKDKAVNDHNIDYSLAIPNNEQTDSFEPEEDLDGTFHENYIEATDNDSNYEITVPSDLEAHEESANSISYSFSQKDSIENSYNGESENTSYKNQVYGEHDEKETEKTDNEFEHFMSKDEMLEKDIEEIQDEMVNENVKSSAQETLSEEIDYENIFEEEENTAEEQDGDFANQETELEEEEIEHEEETENEEDIENNEQNETEEMIESETDITNSESSREESEDDRSTEFTNSDDFEEEETEAETDTEITQSENIDEETETYTGNTQSENIEEETEPETDYDITQSENIEEETEPETDTDILKNENIEEEPEAETYTENKVKENDLEEEEEYETVEDEENNFDEEEEEEQLNNENETGIPENHYGNFEQDEDEDENNQERVLDEIHPLQPPAVKEPSIIYSAIRESNIFDKEEDEEEWDHTNSDNLMFEDVEPPGYLLDIQKEPVEASIEEVRTNENACSLPAETGPCRAYFRRFFFNSKTKECDVFVYGGCNGNGNNFKTLNDCENACGRKNVTL